MIAELMKKKITSLFKRNLSSQLAAIKTELKKKSKTITKGPANLSELSLIDQKLIHQIKERTRQLNLNNVTRTMAYYDFYSRYPEIHWAFLGHMVSRNGGWNMTDLRGELISRLLSEEEQKQFFIFLERGNWLIFQDVYPQFLLYEVSLKIQRNLFYLLPFFHVSTFMETMWNHFWKFGDRYLLTVAQIINEQSYLEHIVIRNPHYQKNVLHTIKFKLQDVLGFNHIIFPYYQNAEEASPQKTGIIGQTLHHFSSLHERIILGKRLYSIIYKDPDVWKRVVSWAADHPHTGSRKDYWPHLFNDVKESLPGAPYKRRTEHCRLRKAAARIYSPALRYAWRNVEHAEAEEEDWFKDWRIIRYFIDHEDEADGGIYDAYCETLEKVELAVIAKTSFFQR